MHLEKLNVKWGDTVKPGAIIGEGQGAGSIFAGKPKNEAHVHSEFRRNGRPVDPSSGQELEFNAVADVKERISALEKAKKAAAKAEKEAKAAQAAAETESKRSPK